jgi:hypothetical protein
MPGDGDATPCTEPRRTRPLSRHNIRWPGGPDDSSLLPCGRRHLCPEPPTRWPAGSDAHRASLQMAGTPGGPRKAPGESPKSRGEPMGIQARPDRQGPEVREVGQASRKGPGVPTRGRPPDRQGRAAMGQFPPLISRIPLTCRASRESGSIGPDAPDPTARTPPYPTARVPGPDSLGAPDPRAQAPGPDSTDTPVTTDRVPRTRPAWHLRPNGPRIPDPTAREPRSLHAPEAPDAGASGPVRVRPSPSGFFSTGREGQERQARARLGIY